MIFLEILPNNLVSLLQLKCTPTTQHTYSSFFPQLHTKWAHYKFKSTVSLKLRFVLIPIQNLSTRFYLPNLFFARICQPFPFIHSFIYSFILSFLRSFFHSSVHSSFPVFIHLFVHSLIYSFLRSYVHKSIRSFNNNNNNNN